RPPNWPAGYNYITDASPSNPDAPINVCGSDAYGLIDCYTTGALRGQPKYYYRWDCYDIGPRIHAEGTPLKVNGELEYERHYSIDWKGITGATDLPNQLKYQNPPPDKTLFTFCTWHCASNDTGSFPAVSMAGSAKKVNYKDMLAYGPYYYNRP